MPRRALHKVWRIVSGEVIDSATLAYLTVFRRNRIRAGLAEYGTAAVGILLACRRAGMPMIVHFHGVDASDREDLKANAATYALLYEAAQRLNMVIAIHIGNGSTSLVELTQPAYDRDSFGLMRFRLVTAGACEGLIESRLPLKFPNLRWAFIEAGSDVAALDAARSETPDGTKANTDARRCPKGIQYIRYLSEQ